MKIKTPLITAMGLIAAAAIPSWPSAASAHGKTVSITPIGRRTGEFCAFDRALRFEIPTGVRILYGDGAHRHLCQS